MTAPPDPALAGVCAIAVMAKAPRPGHVKTRLQAVLTPDEAARLGGAFLRDVTGNLRAAAAHAPIHAFVAYAPAGEEARFDGLLAAGTGLVLADGTGGDADGVEGFGRCLLHAARTLLARGYGAACVLNADSPTLPTALLADAATRLLRPGRRAVLGPAEDGGYWLLGMQAVEAGLFARIAWSTDGVADATRQRAAEAGLPMDVLGAWYDVDDQAGLQRLLDELGSASATQPYHAAATQPYHAPATAACVDALALRARLGAMSA
jgi:rSAM/selenodomain-associated transferase 1